MSLNNLVQPAGRQPGTAPAALASITEAVDIYRRLAQANPAAYLPDLATSLNNLSNPAGRTGDRAGALASITEAVDICRRLAQANPAAYLPDLAMSLNNLVQPAGRDRGPRRRAGRHHRGRRHLPAAGPGQPRRLPPRPRHVAEQPRPTSRPATGDRDGALASITEAVDICRRLAQANPAAYLPDLAMSLNNLVQPAGRQPGTGTGALASITEAVEHLPAAGPGQPGRLPPRPRHVAEQPRPTGRPAAGDRAGALASITEAVDICRRLAQANPAAYLPDLAMSLNNLSRPAGRHRGPRRGAGRHHRSRRPYRRAGPGQPRRLPTRPRRCR